MAKASDFLPALFLVAATAITGGLAAFTAPVLLGIGASVILGAYSGSRARAAARNSLTENRFTSRSSVEPKVTLYGRDRLKTLFDYECTHGDRKQFVTQILILPTSHELDAIEDVLLNDQALGVLTAGQPAGGRYVRNVERVVIEQWMAGTTGSTRTLALPTDGIVTFVALDSLAATVVMAQEYERGGQTYRQGDSIPLVPGTDYSIAGRVVTLLVPDLNSVMQLTATYRVLVGKSLVTVRTFTGTAAGRSDADNAFLVAASGGAWTLAHKLNGIPHLEITFEFDPTIFPTGLPNVSAICRGKRLLNPATGLTVWSQSPALAWRDYMVSKVRVPAGQIDDATVNAAVTACATAYTTAAGPTQAGYTCDGICSSASIHQENLQMILGSMLGSMPRSGGKFSVMAGEWSAPVMTLAEADLADELPSIRTRSPARERCNVIKGKFRDNRSTVDSSGGLYTVTEYPEYRSATYITEDLGRPYTQTLDLPMTLNAERAQRIGKRHMNIRRQSLTVEARFGMTAYKPIVGERVRLPWSRYGWAGTYDGGTGKVFRILKRRYDPATQTVRLVLIEDAQALYDWNFSEATQPDPSSNTDRLNPGLVDRPVVVAVNSSATTYITRESIVYPYVEVEVAPTSANDVVVDVYWKRAADGVFRVTRMPLGETKTRLEPVSGGEVLNVYLVGVNSIGAQSLPTFVLPAYTVSPLLPASNTIIPQSQNLLTNASFEYGVERWKVTGSDAAILKEEGYGVKGSPSNLRMQIDNATAGTGLVRFAYSELIPVNPQLRYVAFAGLIGWGTDALVSIAWYTAAEAAAGPNSDSPNLVPGVIVESIDRRPDRLDHYRRSTVFAKPPAGARYARVLLVAGGTWLAGPYRYLWAVEPFFGVVSDKVDLVPSWGPGGSPVLGTFGLQENSTARVYSTPLAAPVTVSIAAGGPVSGLPVVTLPLADPTIPAGATLTVRCNVVLGALGRAGTAGTITGHRVVLGVLVGEYVGGALVSGLTYPIGYFWDHLWSSPRAIAGLDLVGSAGGSFVVPYVAAREMRMSIVVQQQGGNSNDYTYTSGVGTSISVEVLKR